ncbi:MAG: 4-(cytidine 5'-diphospho)-2-C-methyl-D-erythritol kinase [Erysipelotrichaceae bacterium]|nr:4-(cytidine 5'-diphospho)-2-C-methyl-D-erythritol kinase [Erysipelotrichaceae bacterium]
MKRRAYAKINLGLDVVERREDGYHELNMIMVPIDFYDLCEVNLSETMSFHSNASYLPTDDKNTMLKAVSVMREHFGFMQNFEIGLMKHIPSQAGLAGGSSDAAAVMHMVRELLNLETDDETMIQLAKKVGADVPFCYMEQPAQVSGIGEKMDFFELNSDFYLFLAKPYRGVSTKKAFESLNFKTLRHPNIRAIRDALENGNYYQLIGALGNSLEQTAFELVPQIREIKHELEDFGFDGALMSGSGSTVFAITKDKELLNRASEHFRKKGCFVRKTRIIQPRKELKD